MLPVLGLLGILFRGLVGRGALHHSSSGCLVADAVHLEPGLKLESLHSGFRQRQVIAADVAGEVAQRLEPPLDDLDLLALVAELEDESLAIRVLRRIRLIVSLLVVFVILVIRDIGIAVQADGKGLSVLPGILVSIDQHVKLIVSLGKVAADNDDVLIEHVVGIGDADVNLIRTIRVGVLQRDQIVAIVERYFDLFHE